MTMLLLSPLHEHIAVLGLVELPQSIGHLSALEKFTMYTGDDIGRLFLPWPKILSSSKIELSRERMQVDRLVS